MLIQCPSCAATYDIPDGAIRGAGRKVRCAACKTTWVAESPVNDTPETLPAKRDESVAEELFRRDDLRLAGIDAPAPDLSSTDPATDSVDSDAPVPAVPDAASVDVFDDTEPAPHLKIEATTEDDLVDTATDDPENSQDDVDALFNTPSVADFGPISDDSDMEEAAHDSAAPVDGDAPAEGSAPAKKRLRMSDGTSKPKRPLPLALAASLVLLMGLGGSVLYRQSVVAAMPQTARLFSALGLPVNLRGIEIRNVTSRVGVEQGVQQLVVEGEIVNLLASENKLSRLRFGVRSESGQEIYSWKAPADKPALSPGETIKFRKRLASPPDGSVDVQVRFETRGDMVAGVQ